MQFSAVDEVAVDAVRSVYAKCVVLVVSGRPHIPDPSNCPRSTVSSPPPCVPGRVRGCRHPLRESSLSAKLPVTWSRSLAQEPINVGDANHDPLLANGFGLATE